MQTEKKKSMGPIASLFLCLLCLSSAWTMAVSSSNISYLVGRSLQLLEKSSNAQVFIGIAGGPGSGKSTLAQEVSHAINQVQPISIVLSMDGYHIPRAELEKMGRSGKVIGDPCDCTNGDFTTYEDLMLRRGAPWTFDPCSLIRDLTIAKKNGEGNFPVYSREISDPVPNGAIVTHKHKIIFCEGNYLLALDDPEWKPLESIWDDKWYITVQENVVMVRLVNRHLERWNAEKQKLWGDGRAGAMRKVEASDLKNYRWIEATSRSHANLIIEN
jgi:pantothenate kinase